MMYSPSAKPLDHVAIAVHSIEDSASHYELLSGDVCSPIETLEAQGVRVAFVGTIELLEPLSPDTTVGRFLERRGQGLHHIAYRTDDLATFKSHLDAAGVPYSDWGNKAVAGWKQIFFYDPDGNVIEVHEVQDEAEA